MSFRKPKNRKEICYPFIYETALTCDYEIHTDELCSLVGMALATLPDGFDDVREDLETLHPKIYHLNGSVRGKNAIFEEDLEWLHARYDHYNELSRGRINRFVLPRGPVGVMALHQCRTGAKKTVRLLHRLDESGVTFEPVLPRFANLLANFFFVLTVYIKMKLDVEEIEFVSLSY
ncbi:ATP--cob(I)alamin adenosyltransferase [Grimontia hollisae]|uniref:ATP--cob(I)alamin adenosyltransferase n=1 Tax=Grimontia hollisae TaxID=673 RepID=UPI000E07C527|nr:ATP--cob(I)alamin adenosyltransferase [Grimontia hollisae]MDF2184890.1 ATP--cob(I)alamin adenosyltransferase [Grimontia hollisae]STQ74519.1 Cob(I)yrinic acid a,c-diamide adenosyltransferase [Grimontia hollisae]